MNTLVSIHPTYPALPGTLELEMMIVLGRINVDYADATSDMISDTATSYCRQLTFGAEIPDCLFYKGKKDMTRLAALEQIIVTSHDMTNKR